jgi:hypothetical protein
VRVVANERTAVAVRDHFSMLVDMANNSYAEELRRRRADEEGQRAAQRQRAIAEAEERARILKRPKDAPLR